jgi:hypothetical protein
MIEQNILHHKILEKLPSTALRTGGGGGMGVVYEAEADGLLCIITQRPIQR